jgi:hypothetical protein
MARLYWVEMSNKWWRLVDRETKGGVAKYRGYNEEEAWQIIYPDPRKNHRLLQSEVSEEQLRHNLEMQYLLTRCEDEC